MAFWDYIHDLPYHLYRGRGVCLFNCPEADFRKFELELKQHYQRVLALATSELSPSGRLQEFSLAGIDHCLLFQDLSLEALEQVIQTVRCQILMPCYHHNKPISLCSKLAASAYPITIPGRRIHEDLNWVRHQLWLEQMVKLLETVNYYFPDPLKPGVTINGKLATLLEKKLALLLEKNSLKFDHQVKLASGYVDFILELKTGKLAIDCEPGERLKTREHQSKRQWLYGQGLDYFCLTGCDLAQAPEQLPDRITTPSHNPVFALDSELLRDSYQAAAIAHGSGPARVLAPAGSGKTKTLINRIVHLINQDVPPRTILALAFNKKAAAEMRQRLVAKNVPVAKSIFQDGVTVTTFHGFGYEIIRRKLGWQYHHSFGGKRSRDLMVAALKPDFSPPMKRNYDPIAPFLLALRKTKTELPVLGAIQVETEEKRVPFGDIFRRYLKLQADQKFLNFDDMIYLCLRLLVSDTELRAELQTRFQYLLVDEFQDLNQSQHLLMQILALPQDNLFVVGDDDQMIYGWRGADVRQILDFPQVYPETRDYLLHTNYRCAKNVVSHSRWLIDHNTTRIAKAIQPRTDARSGRFDLRLDHTLWNQARNVLQWLQEVHATGYQWRDFAILFRYHAYRFTIATVLAAAKIPHTPVNPAELFQTQVGQDIYCYLTMMLQGESLPADALARLLRRPEKYLKTAFIRQIQNFTDLLDAPYRPDLDDRARRRLTDFLAQFLTLKNLVGPLSKSPGQFLLTMVEKFGLESFYRTQKKIFADPEDGGDPVLLEVILSLAESYTSLTDFYQFIGQARSDSSPGSPMDETESPIRPPGDEITLTTIHATKGNEYKNVVLLNLAPPLMKPSSSKYEEERRVAYVGLTRSIEHILITGPTDHYSAFIPEAALNPAFEKKSLPQLKELLKIRFGEQSRLAKKIRRLENKIRKISEKSAVLATKENIPSGTGKLSGQWFRNQFLNWLQKRKHRYTLKLEKARACWPEIGEKMVQIERELSHREILNLWSGAKRGE